MKKVIASALLFIVTTLVVINSFAKVELSKDNLQSAYNKLAEKYEGEYKTMKGTSGYMSREASTPVKVENDELVYEVDKLGEKVTKKIKYDLTNKPTFSYEVTITKDSTLSDLYDIGDNMELPIIGAVGSAIVQGVDDKTADTYRTDFSAAREIRKYNAIVLAGDQLSVGNMETEDDMKVFKKDEIDNFEFLDYAIKDKVELKDEINNFYTYKFTKTKTSDTEYLLKAELVVNLDADLSSVSSKAENTNEVNNTTNNTVNNTTNNVVNNTPTVIIANTNTNKNNVTNNTVKNNTVNNAITTSNTSMPFVGSDNTVPKLICVFLAIAFINAIKLRNLDKKNND